MINQTWLSQKSKKYKKIIFQIILYLLGVYFFGLSISLYLDLNLGAIHEDVFVFAFVYILGWNHDQNYFLGLLILYAIYFFIILILRLIKIYFFYRQKKLTKKIIQKEILLWLLDIIPIILWPLSEKLNSLFINSELIGSYEIWIRYWVLWASYVIFCLSMSLIVYSKILYGPYNSLSSLITEIFGINYTFSRILVDVIITLIGILLIFANKASLDIKWTNFKNWVSLATILVTFFSGPFINYLVKLFNRWYLIK